MRPLWRVIAPALACAGALSAAEPAGLVRSKDHYHLFRPTPPELMRELSTDRPDQTESPFTVDAGHFQVELDFVNAVFDDTRTAGENLRSEVWGVGALNLKVGLLNQVDLQIVFDNYVRSRVEHGAVGAVSEADGFGDLYTRLKINFWGNDGGRTAFGIMPFVKWPLAKSDLRNGRTEGGIILPFSMDLGGGWGLGAMTEFDFVAEDSGGYNVEYFNTITVGRDLVGNFGAYVEFAALVAPESNDDWQGQIAVGFTFGFNEHTQLDWGCNFGVTEFAPDFNPFAGFSYRF